MFFSSCSFSFSRRRRWASICVLGTCSTRSSWEVERLVGAGGRRVGAEFQRDAGEPADGVGVAPGDFQRIAARVERALQLQLGIELHLRAQGARQGDDFLQHADFALGGEVGVLAAILRILGERDGNGARGVAFRAAARALR